MNTPVYILLLSIACASAQTNSVSQNQTTNETPRTFVSRFLEDQKLGKGNANDYTDKAVIKHYAGMGAGARQGIFNFFNLAEYRLIGQGLWVSAAQWNKGSTNIVIFARLKVGSEEGGAPVWKDKLVSIKREGTNLAIMYVGEDTYNVP